MHITVLPSPNFQENHFKVTYFAYQTQVHKHVCVMYKVTKFELALLKLCVFCCKVHFISTIFV